MSASEYRHINVDYIAAETDKAFLFECGSKQFWVPMSVLADPDDYKRGDRHLSIAVKEWFAEKEGLPEEGT